MKIFIASDHGGFELKKTVIEDLKPKNYDLTDLGAFELDSNDDYTDFAAKLSDEIIRYGKNVSANVIGILICRSGIGMSIAANKVKGIYAALCFTPLHAKRAREHNNANVLCLDSDYGDVENHKKVVETFIESNFIGWDTRHGRRIKKIEELERKNFK